MASRSNGRSALSRHLSLLDAFDADAAFLTLSQLSRRSGVPLSSVHRLVGELEQHGLVERLGDGTFRLGVRLWELAARTPGALGLRELALPYMQDVQSAVRQHTQLAVLSGREVLFLERLSTREAVINVTLVGGKLPLHASSSGLVLLAHAAPELVEAVLTAPLRQFTASTVVDPIALRALLGQIRRSGFAVGDGFIHPDSRGIAVPVLSAENTVVAALSVVVPNNNKPPEPLIELLRRASGLISDELRSAYLPAGDPGAEPGGRYRPLVHSSTRSMEYLASGRLAGSS